MAGVLQRPLRDEDLEQLWDLEREAFNAAPAERHAWERWERAIGVDRLEGVFLDGRLVAVAGVLPLGQWFGGRRVAMGGLRAVATRNEQRGRGFATRAVRAQLDAMRTRGEWLSALFPAVVRPYRRLGWGIAGTLFHRHVPTRALQAVPPSPVAVRRATDADRDRIRACYDRVARTTNGFVDRSTLRWDWMLARHADAFWYVAGDDGYCVQEAHDPPPAGIDGFRVRVVELVATSRPALCALWRMLGAASSTVPTVIFRSGPTDPLPALLDGLDVRTGHERQWMLRLVDVAGAVASRGFPADARVAVPLEIVDDACPWNAGRAVLVVEEGRGRLDTGGPGTVRVDVGALAALYSGWATPLGLQRLGMLSGGGAAELDALARAFAGPLPWMLDEF